MAGIYKVENLANGKIYIGISQDVRRRVRGHFFWTNVTAPLLSRAIKKYGPSSFLVTPLYYSISGTEHLPQLEAELISETRSALHGYNVQLASGAVGPYGEKFKEAIRAAHARPGNKERYSAAQKLSKGTPEARQRQSERAKEMWAKPGAKEKLSEGLRKAAAGPEYKAGCRTRALAIQTPEFVESRIAKMIETMSTPEFRAKRSKASALIHKDPKVRSKLEAKMRLTMATPEFKIKRSAASIKMHTPEVRAKKSATLKAVFAATDLAARIAASKLGRILITDGTKRRFVYPEAGIPEGWRPVKKT